MATRIEAQPRLGNVSSFKKNNWGMGDCWILASEKIMQLYAKNRAFLWSNQKSTFQNAVLWAAV
jgi:hypothetical protein